MKNVDIFRAPPAAFYFNAVPLELHGHKKKLLFIWNCVEQFRCANGLQPDQIRILEVGCSNGRNIATPLAECGYRVTGIDLHRPSIQYADSHNPFRNARFLCQDLSELPEDEHFEIIVLSDVLEHVPDPESLCTTAIRYLAKGGLVLISIPNGFGPYENEQRIIRLFRLNPLIDYARAGFNALLGRRTEGRAYNYESGHIQFFRLKDFELLLGRVGLNILRCSNGALFGGTLSYTLQKLVPFIVAPSLRLADWLPRRWVSTWYFCCSSCVDVDNR